MTSELNSATFRAFTDFELATYRDWWAIYENCFPSSERESSDVILSSLKTGKGMAFGAFHNKRLIGISTIHLLQEPAAVFLVYLSLIEDYRGQGIGRSFLTYIFSQGQVALQNKGLEPIGNIWEVERPSEATTEHDRLGREKRIRFFEDNDARCLPLNYTQPPVDGKTCVPMLLMLNSYAQINSGADLPLALAKAIYLEKYGAVNNISHTILNKLINGL